MMQARESLRRQPSDAQASLGAAGDTLAGAATCDDPERAREMARACVTTLGARAVADMPPVAWPAE